MRRAQVAGSNRYWSSFTAQEIEQKLVRDFYEETLSGSLRPLLRFLISLGTISDQDLALLEEAFQKHAPERNAS